MSSHSWSHQITVGIGDEVRQSNMELGSMVSRRPISYSVHSGSIPADHVRTDDRLLNLTERRLYVHLIPARWDLQADEQDGSETRRKLVLVHALPRPDPLDIRRRMVQAEDDRVVRARKARGVRGGVKAV